MQFLLDNVAATIILLVMVVLLVGLHQRGQQASTERSAMYAAKKQALEYADVLSRELSLVGSKMPSDQLIDTVHVDANGNTDLFRFWRKDSACNNLLIEYRLVAVDTVSVDDETTTTLYEVQRFENGTQRGASMPTLESFSIEPLDMDGESIGTAYDTAQQVRIQFTNLLPYALPAEYYLPRTYWRTTLRPAALRINSDGSCTPVGGLGSGSGSTEVTKPTTGKGKGKNK